MGWNHRHYNKYDKATTGFRGNGKQSWQKANRSHTSTSWDRPYTVCSTCPTWFFDSNKASFCPKWCIFCLLLMVLSGQSQSLFSSSTAINSQSCSWYLQQSALLVFSATCSTTTSWKISSHLLEPRSQQSPRRARRWQSNSSRSPRSSWKLQRLALRMPQPWLICWSSNCLRQRNETNVSLPL
jgi:hypothetical protein